MGTNVQKGLQLFNNPKFGNVRAVEINNEAYFVGRDVAICLGYENTNKAILDHVDSEDKKTVQLTDIQVGNETIPPHMKGAKAVIINESGVYSLIFGSKLESAKEFKKWVTSEVLPSIRKHGAYMTDNTLESVLTNPDLLIGLATQLKEERAEKERLQEQNRLSNEQLRISVPKVEYFDEVLLSESAYTTNQIAKEFGFSAETLNKKLKEMGVQYKQSGTWLLTCKYQDKGYTKTRTHTFTRSDGKTGTNMLTVWTEKGRLFIHELLKEKKTA